MSSFSDVDGSGAIESLSAYLTMTDRAMTAFKSYVTAAAARALCNGRVLDIGAGLGFDLDRLSAAGLSPIGVDTSFDMLERARSRCDALAQADGTALPFRDGSIDGCRIERVLQHVADPAAVLDEVARVVRAGGFVAVLEPDYRRFWLESTVCPDGGLPARAMRVRHPAVGGAIEDLLAARGFRIDDVVTESSRGYRLDALPIHAELVLRRAVTDGRLDSTLAERWLAEQRGRTADHTFRAGWDKVLVVGTRVA